ncbi:MAG: TetR/AcrR family transcriptional regulator [Xanthobacteraceae bacterium]|jgi:AcrR family transcriptional regulator
MSDVRPVGPRPHRAPRRASRDATARQPRRNPAASRDKIMKTARAEFARHGFAGARIARIVANSGSNPRMVYHYFGSKSALYIAVLEDALGDLRSKELLLDVEHLDPLEGLLQLFDFMNSHFEAHQDLVRLLVTENLQTGRYMRKSARIREMSFPVLEMIARFLTRGTTGGQLAAGLDPLRLYVMMVALTQFHLSNVHTLSIIFARDLSAPEWRRARAADARRMLAAFLTRETAGS